MASEGRLDIFYKRKKFDCQRRVVTCIIIFLFVCLFVFTWFWFLHAQFVKRNETERENVLIYAPARSGSSFLGQIFNQHEDVFYLYEPLYVYAVLNKLRVMKPSQLQQDSMALLEDSFQCNFTNHKLFLYFISNPGYASTHFRESSKALSTPPLCFYKERPGVWNEGKIGAKICENRLETRATTRVCQNHKQVTVKVLSHRIRLQEILKWITNSRKNSLKVIHLLRDPRAIIASRLRLGWISSKSSSSKVQKFCRRMSENLQFAANVSSRISRNYIILRYEDLVKNVFPVVRRIFRATGLHLGESQDKWLVENARWRGSMETLEPFRTTKRNALKTANLWRKNISINIVRDVEQSCKYIMKEAGYRVAKNLDELRNENISLLARPTQSIRNFFL